MKVLHVVTHLGQGGTEAVLYRLIEATQQKINHSVVSLHGQGVYGPMLRKIGVDVEVLDMPRGRLKLAGLWRLRQIIRSYNPDIIHTRLYHADLIGGVVALFAGAPPVIWTVNSSDLGPLRKSWKTKFIRQTCAILSHWLPSAIVADAKNTKKVNVSLGYSPKKFFVINNGIDLSSFYPNQQAGQRLRHELQIQEDVLLLGFVARWDPLKDHSNLLQALSIIKGNDRKFVCILVGSEMVSQNAVLMDLIHKNELDDHMILPGPRSDIPAIMNVLDLHVLSSFSESMPLAIIEAMACGTPCVVTDVGDAALVVGDTGWVVPPKDPKALAAGIESGIEALEKNGKDELGQRCRRVIEEKYSLEVMVDSYLKLWEKTVAGFESKAARNTVKVLHVIIGLDIGGAELTLKRLTARHISDFRSSHIVVSLSGVGVVGQQLREQGVEVVALGLNPLGLNSVRELPRIFFRLVKLIRYQRPDIVQTWMYHADLIGGLAARLAGCRKIIWGIRNTDLFPGNGISKATCWIMKLCAILSGFVPHTILCVGNRAKSVHADSGYTLSKIKVIHNGFDFENYKPNLAARNRIRLSLNVPPDAMIIGSVGRFNEYKDYRGFVIAAANLASADKKSYFLMVGRDIDSENSTLMQWIEETGFSDRFRLLGERKDVPEIFAAMDIFCLHSKSEGFPNVLGEAMCTGLPSVVTDVGDAAVLLGNAGLMVQPQDIEGLTKGLLTLVQSTSETRAALGNIARKRIQENYSMEAVKQQYEDLYQKVLSK
jgi:glycosyltransferase involved in cell wall biosynthesis